MCNLHPFGCGQLNELALPDLRTMLQHEKTRLSHSKLSLLCVHAVLSLSASFIYVFIQFRLQQFSKQMKLINYRYVDISAIFCDNIFLSNIFSKISIKMKCFYQNIFDINNLK